MFSRTALPLVILSDQVHGKADEAALHTVRDSSAPYNLLPPPSQWDGRVDAWHARGDVNQGPSARDGLGAAVALCAVCAEADA